MRFYSIQTQFSKYHLSTLNLQKRSWNYFACSPFISQLLWKKIELRDRNQNYCSSGCRPLFIVVPQAVNELPSQHWTKRAKIVRWYCARVKKTSYETYLKQRVFLRKHISANWANIAQVSSLNDVVSDLFGQHWIFNVPMQCCPSLIDSTLYKVLF